MEGLPVWVQGVMEWYHSQAVAILAESWVGLLDGQ